MFDNTYTKKEDYKTYNDSEPPNNYFKIEETAIIWLSKYSLAFPNYEEFLEMEKEDKVVYEYIYKAILLQMYYIVNNMNIYTHVQNGGNYKMGRISVTNGTMTPNEQEKSKFCPDAIEMMEKSGIVVHELCDENIDACNDCGCDFL